LTDLNSRVPVVIEPSRRRAILTGDNTASPKLELDVGEGAIHPGDRVLTTGDGGVLPPDLPVGVVMGGGDAPEVALFAAADASDYVQVLDYGPSVRTPVASAADVVASENSAASSAARFPVKPAARTAAEPARALPRTTTAANDDEDR
jgi:hypothetical protein